MILPFDHSVRRPLRYVNGLGEEVAFSGRPSPFFYGDTDIFDLTLTHETLGGSIVSLKPTIKDMGLEVRMRGGSPSDIDRFVDVVSWDSDACKPGTLWAGSTYMRCYITAASFSNWQYLGSAADIKVTVTAERPVWVRSASQDIVPQAAERAGGLDYPHDYPHDYGYDEGSQTVLRNPFRLPARADIAFAGPCANPYAKIGDNRYQVNESARKGELIMVRGYGDNRDIVVRGSDGVERSVFAKGVREPGAKVFGRIPPGDNEVLWPGTYPISVTMYEERMVPCWT